MIARVDRARIAALPFFAGLPEQELDAIAGAAGEVAFAAGESLTAEGQFGHGLYFIEEGTADVSTNGTKIGAVEPGWAPRCHNADRGARGDGVSEQRPQ